VNKVPVGEFTTAGHQKSAFSIADLLPTFDPSVDLVLGDGFPNGLSSSVASLGWNKF
jgi:hypothetical protein